MVSKDVTSKSLHLWGTEHK